MKKDRHTRLTEDGIPRDARELTEADWRSIHLHLEAMKREISERHKKKTVIEEDKR